MNQQGQESTDDRGRGFATGAPAAGRLAIFVCGHTVYTATRASAHGKIDFGSIKVDPSMNTSAKIIEEAVYATPSLLDEFSRTDIVVDADRFAVVPKCLADDKAALQAFASSMWPGADDYRIVVDEAGPGAAVVSMVDAALSGFTTRTFCNVSLHYRLAVLTRFVRSLSRPINRVKIYACFSAGDRLDIVACTSDELLMANTFACSSPLDSVYYILAAAKDCGFDPLDDELLLSGDNDRRNEATDTLRRYLNSVMPLLLPDNPSSPLELKVIDQ